MKMDHAIDLKQTTTSPSPAISDAPRLGACMERALGNYFHDLDGRLPADLYRRVLDQVEPPLLEKVMIQTRGNQSRAAEILGISRGTLRTRLKRHGMA